MGSERGTEGRGEEEGGGEEGEGGKERGEREGGEDQRPHANMSGEVRQRVMTTCDSDSDSARDSDGACDSV